MFVGSFMVLGAEPRSATTELPLSPFYFTLRLAKLLSLASNLWSSCFCLQSPWDYRGVTPHPAEALFDLTKRGDPPQCPLGVDERGQGVLHPLLQSSHLVEGTCRHSEDAYLSLAGTEGGFHTHREEPGAAACSTLCFPSLPCFHTTG